MNASAPLFAAPAAPPLRPPAATAPAVQVAGLYKSFGGNRVLRGVDFHVMPGEIHALMGQNGCGKSTLMKIIDGLLAADAGEVAVNGEPVAGGSRTRGVGMVHQELSLVPSLSIAENISLQAIPSKAGFLRRGAMGRIAREALARVGCELDPDTPVAELSLAERQLVEIARVLQLEPAVMMLDEPTSSLSVAETQRLFEVLRRLAAGGTAIIYVSHRMDEVYAICSTATVLRDGQLIGRVELADTPLDALIRMTIGHSVQARSEAGRAIGELVLETAGLSSARIREVSIRVHAGEIVGLAGLVGAGRTETARALFGLDRITGGGIRLQGRALRPRDPRAAIAAGIAYLPENRAHEGLARELDVQDNAMLAALPGFSPGYLLRHGRLRAAAKGYVEQLAIHPADVHYLAGALSGGNQQKVVLAKWLATRPKLFILDEPTRGVDIGAKTAIRDLILQLAAEGVAVLVISSELPELFDLADRLYVMRDGGVAREFARAAFDEHAVIRAWNGADAEVNP